MPLVPEADQQVRAQAHHRPADDQEDEVVGQDEEQHREDEDVHVGEEAGVARAVLVLHVADRVGDDQTAHAGDDEAHEDREVVDQQAEGQLERAALDPRVVSEVLVDLAEVQGDDAHERSPDDPGPDDHGEDPGQPPAAARQDDRTRGGEKDDQEREQLRGHPLSSLRSSMSSASRTRKMSTRIASPPTASAAATVIDIRAKSWPSMFWSWRANVTSVRLAALSMSSIEIRITSGLRRTSTPMAPRPNRTALRRRNHEASSCAPPMLRELTGRRYACG